jgi:hypothetical protein
VLRSNYLLVLDEAYLFAERGAGGGELLAAEQTPKVIVALVDQVRFFRTEVMPRCLDFIEDNALAKEAYFVYERVLKTIGLVRFRHLPQLQWSV